MDRDAESLLTPLRDLEPDGPGTVDVARAVRRGRRVVRGRLAFSALGVVVAVVAGALVVPSLVHHDKAPVPAAAPGEFSVLRQEFGFDPVAGYTLAGYSTGQYQQVLSVSSDRGSALVKFFAAGKLPRPGWVPVGTETEPVVGIEPAYYLAHAELSQFDQELAWQWAPGAWAIVDVMSEKGSLDDDRRDARQIAEHVRNGYGAILRTPFTVAKPPHGWRLLGVDTIFPPDRLPTIGVEFGDPVVDTTFVSPTTLQVIVAQAGGAGGDVESRPMGRGLVAYVSGAASAADKQQVLNSVRLSVGTDPADHRYWTTSPIR